MSFFALLREGRMKLMIVLDGAGRKTSLGLSTRGWGRR